MSEIKNNSNKKKKAKKRTKCQKESNNYKTKQNSSCNNKQSNSNNTHSKLCCFSSVDYIVLASTLAIALGEELSSSDLGILSTFFAVLSDELALIQSVNSCNNNNNDPIFTPPIADIAVTSSKNKINKNKKK